MIDMLTGEGCDVLCEPLESIRRVSSPSRVARGPGPVVVGFDAVAADAIGHPVAEGGQGVAVPFLEGVAGVGEAGGVALVGDCLLYTSPSPRD